MAAQAPHNGAAHHHNNHHHAGGGGHSSSEIWRQFWAFQQSFSFCKTSSVVERLRKSSPGMTSLRLVGVEGYQNYLVALTQALHKNTTLEQVSICASFLQHYPPTLSSSSSSSQNEEEDPLYQVFRAIGGLPKVTRIKLEGNEDAKVFSISLLTTMLAASSCQRNVSLQEFTCHYVDLVGTSCEWQEFGNVLQQLAKAGNLHSVTMMNIQILQQPTNHTQESYYGLLDPIISNLGHCPQVELGWRKRHIHHTTTADNNNGAGLDLISPLALQKYLLMPLDNHESNNIDNNNNTKNNVLQNLTLGPRIPLQYSPHLSTILECLQIPSSLSSPSCTCVLREMQLDDIHYVSTSNDVVLLWQQMAAMLQCNTTLQSVYLTFATPQTPTPITNGAFPLNNGRNHQNNNTTMTITTSSIMMMDLASTTAMTKALAVNKTLKRLCLRGGEAAGARAGAAGGAVISGTLSMATTSTTILCQKMWLTLLEHHNYTLEELVLFEDDYHPPAVTVTTAATAATRHNHPTEEHHEKMQFYLQLNRQPVTIRQQKNDISSNNNNNLRALLHNSGDALAPKHILPCLEAAMEIQNTINIRKHQHNHAHPHSVIGGSTLFDSWFDRDIVDDDDDDDDDDDMFAGGTASSRRHHPKKHIGDISGLYFLLSQHPCILLAVQERLSKINDNDKTTSGSQLSKNTMNDDYKKASIPLGGASPQLLLLDDDIVALW